MRLNDRRSITTGASQAQRAWVAQALQRIEADSRRSADTHLIPLALPEAPGVMVYLKDESTHPSGSLKHRLARSLFLYGLCNGLIGPGTTIVEASSGSTAISEAFFARLPGRRVGPSTGCNFAGVLHLARRMAAKGETGSIATLICDAGERYDDTLHAPGWVAVQGLDAAAAVQDSDALA